MIRPILNYLVAPAIPQQLEFLKELAYNLIWVWDHELMELFIRLDPDLWESTSHNPVLMLGTISQTRLEMLADDDSFIAQVSRARVRYEELMDRTKSWYQRTHGKHDGTIAYFSAEFGLTECLQNYSGGLGILSGDHLKSASDLGIPLVAVGLLYQKGYFRQYLNADGWQQENNPENDFFTLPIHQECDEKGKPITITVELPGRAIHAKIWKVNVGRVPLYLLDTNIPENSQVDQDITDQLYGGDRELRIIQEIVLGIGGYRALKAIGIQPSVFHMNEGHSAFLAIERCLDLMHDHGFTFAQAREAATASMVFTTHTPVPAGNDYFVAPLVEKYFSNYIRNLGIPFSEFLGLGRKNPSDHGEDFCMTIMALRMSAFSNGVSKLHGVVSRKMWQNVWPDVPESELPIGSITNGVHAPSWVSRDIEGLLSRYLGPGWREDPGQTDLWDRVKQIPDAELWKTHERRRERLVAFARTRLRKQLEHRGAPPSEVSRAEEILDPEALTIGFARRFATYKRATLMFHNMERITRILDDRQRPLQIIFAGKAHPHDNPGKDLIRQIIHAERNPLMRSRMVFIEDYDMVVARYLVQGVDIWLNTPRRPLEASGTSGMKASVNGALNLSILDGWWAEAYSAENGWSIGNGEEYTDTTYQDEVESNALYDLLEKEIIPLFYTRGNDNLPRGWISKMKSAIRNIGPVFNTNRMVRDYTEEMYLAAGDQYHKLIQSKGERAKKLAEWKTKLHDQWPRMRILDIKSDTKDGFKVGDTLKVSVVLSLGEIEPPDIDVQLYYGQLNAHDEIEVPQNVTMKFCGNRKDGTAEFSGSMTFSASGRMGHTIRILPHHRDLQNPFRMGLVKWATQ